MVEFFTFDPSFTSWTPSTEEFQSFIENNKYYNPKGGISTSRAAKDSVAASRTTLAPAPVHAYALTMTRRLVCSNSHQYKSVSFTMEETRTNVERDESKCPICAVERKERQFLLDYQKLKESSKVVRNMCLRKEHPKTRHMCTKHRPYEPNEGIPKCASDSYFWRDPRFPNLRRTTVFGTPTVDYSIPPFSCEQNSYVPKRTFKPETEPAEKPMSSYQFGLTMGSCSARESDIPKPAETVDHTIDWFNYYQQPDVHRTRMAYTKSFNNPNENVENFPSKRMTAEFDIDCAKLDDN